MAKKIEGFLVGDYQFAVFPPDDCPTKAVLVVSDEPVYTASEVRAMLDAVDAMEHFTGAQIQMLAEYGFDVMGLAVPKADHHDPQGADH